MRKLLCLAVVLAPFSTICSAQDRTETFGTGANAFTIDFVTIGNPNNAADETGIPSPAGSVAYTYNLGKYEVSRDMIDKANAEGSLGIEYTGFSGSANKPGTGITWLAAAKFVNWLNTSTGSTAAYKFDGSGTFQLWSAGDAGYNASNLFRNSLAKYWLPSSDEWYKGAYGSPSGTWYDYATGSNSAPTAVASGTAANTAVYNNQSNTADITSAGGLSPWGTMAQGGNVMEWNETASDGNNNTADENRLLRNGGFYNGSVDSSSVFSMPAGRGDNQFGFRVASVPEPSSLSLLAVGLGGLALIRRRK